MSLGDTLAFHRLFEQFFIKNPRKQLLVQFGSSFEAQKIFDAIFEHKTILTSKLQFWQTLEATNCLFQGIVFVGLLFVIVDAFSVLVHLLENGMGPMILEQKYLTVR